MSTSRSLSLAAFLALPTLPALGGQPTILLEIPGASGEPGSPSVESSLISGFRQNFLTDSCATLTVTKPLGPSASLFATAAASKRTIPELALLVSDGAGGREALRIVYRNLTIAHAEVVSGPDGAMERIEFSPASRASVEIFRASAPSEGAKVIRIEMTCPDESARVVRAVDRPQRVTLRPSW
jgi:hypothetical protein